MPEAESPVVESVLEMSFILTNQGLLVSPEHKQRFIDNCGQEATLEAPSLAIQLGSSPELTAPPQETQNLVMPRDRVTMELAPNRFAFKRAFPEEADLQRLSELLSLAFTYSPHATGRATFGYNIEVVYFHNSPSPSGQYLADKLLRENLQPALINNLTKNAQLIGPQGSSLQFVYACNNRRWTPRFEPRAHNRDPHARRVFLSLNCHYENQSLQLAEALIRDELMSVWNHAHMLISLVDSDD